MNTMSDAKQWLIQKIDDIRTYKVNNDNAFEMFYEKVSRVLNDCGLLAFGYQGNVDENVLSATEEWLKIMDTCGLILEQMQDLRLRIGHPKMFGIWRGIVRDYSIVTTKLTEFLGVDAQFAQQDIRILSAYFSGQQRCGRASPTIDEDGNISDACYAPPVDSFRPGTDRSDPAR